MFYGSKDSKGKFGLYKRIGHIEVGAIPNLYRDGITEHLMMKLRTEKS